MRRDAVVVANGRAHTNSPTGGETDACRVLAEHVECTLGDADARGGHANHQERGHGDVKPGTASSGIGSTERHLVTLGEHQVVGAVVRTAGALQAGHVPAVLDLDAIGRNCHRRPERRTLFVRSLLAVFVEQAHAAQDPVAVPDSARVGPAPVQPISTLERLRGALGIGRAGEFRIGRSKGSIECLALSQMRTGQSSDHRLDHRAPAGRDIGAGQINECFKLSRRVGIETADFSGPGELERFDFLKCRNRRRRERAQLDRFRAVRPQRRRDRFDPFSPIGKFALELTVHFDHHARSSWAECQGVRVPAGPECQAGAGLVGCRRTESGSRAG